LRVTTTIHIEPTLISDLLNLALEQKKNGLKESTITGEIRRLKQMAKMCNLNNPEEVKNETFRDEMERRNKKAICGFLL